MTCVTCELLGRLGKIGLAVVLVLSWHSHMSRTVLLPLFVLPLSFSFQDPFFSFSMCEIHKVSD